MNTLIAQATQPPTPTLPAPPNALTEWGLLLAAGVWIAKNAWALFADKEARESQMTSDLINDLRKDRAELVTSNKAGFQDIVRSIGNLQETLKTGQCEVDQDFQSLRKDQAGIYAQINQELALIKQAITKLHDRLDEFEAHIKVRA